MAGMKWIGSSTDLALFEREEVETPRKQKPLEADAWSGTILNRRGTALLHLGRYAEALADFERILDSDPENIPILQQSSTALIHIGRYGEANIHLDAVLEKEPHNVIARLMKAEVREPRQVRRCPGSSVRWCRAPAEMTSSPCRKKGLT